MRNGKEMDALISVVIPVYNVSKYLDRCLQSVVNQTYTNLEIILVDDGSTDSCPAMCDEWARRDRRISVIHKKNAGLGMARNTGIEHATGQYICFFDSDDYIELTTIEHAVRLAEEEQSDIVVFGMSVVNGKGNLIRRRIPITEQSCFRGAEVLETFLPSLLQYAPPAAKVKNLCLSVCSCLFSMELIRRSKWRFVSEREIISEDVYSLLGLCKHVKNVAVLSEALYYYCENDTSLTHSYRADRFDKNKQFYLKCIALCDRYEYSNLIRRSCMNPFLGNVLGAMKQETAFYSDKKEAIKRLRTTLEDEVLQSVLQKKKKDHAKLKIRILFWAMRHRHCHLCYALLVAHNSTKYK